MKKEEAAVQREEQRTEQSNSTPLGAGEKVFAVVILILGIAAFGLALNLWMQMKEPRIASAAAMPLFVSGLWVVMAPVSYTHLTLPTILRV